MFGKTEVATPTATIAAAGPQGDAPEGSLHYDTRGALLFARDGGRWVRVGQVVLVSAPENFSQKHPRLQGHPH